MNPDGPIHPEPDAQPEQPIDPALDALFGFGDVLDTWLDLAARAIEPPPPLGLLGPYTLLSELGRGGQGAVYRAIQPGTRRTVALKRLSAALMFDSKSHERFSREVDALTRLNHPGIVTVHSAEVVEGHPILIMECVEGKPIDQWADALHSANPHNTLNTLLNTFALTCDAVAHAHQRGVIHRDIKPSNILVDAVHQPHVLDFGIARLSTSHTGPQTAFTTGFVGTPAYAAPEQFDANPDHIDIRADVYSLGTVLYRILTGTEPFSPSAGLRTLVQLIRIGPSRTPSSLRPSLGRELDWIVAKAMHIDPAERYQTVDAFAQDIRNFLTAQPVSAHPPSALYHARKFITRHWAATLIACLVLVVLLAATIISTTSLISERRARHDAITAARAAELREHAAQIRAAAAAQAAGDSGATRATLAQVPADRRNFEWNYLYRASDDAHVVIPGSTTPGAYRRASIFDELLAVSDSFNATLTFYRTEQHTFTPIGTITNGAYGSVLYAPQHRLIITADGIARIESSAITPIASHTRTLPAIIEHPDGRLFALDDHARLLRSSWTNAIAACETLHQSTTPTPIDIWHDTGITVPISTNLRSSQIRNHQLALATDIGELAIIDLDTYDFIIAPQPVSRSAEAIAWHPTRDIIAIASYDPHIILVSSITAQRIGTIARHDEVTSGVAFSPDGTRLFTSSWDGTVRIWDFHSAQLLRTLRGHAGPIRSMAVDPHAAFAYTAGDDGSVRTWNLNAEPQHPRTLRTADRPLAIAASTHAPQSGWIIVGGDPSNISGSNLSTTLAINTTHNFARHPLIQTEFESEFAYQPRVRTRAIDVSPDDAIVAVGDHRGLMHLFNLPDPQLPDPPTLLRSFFAGTSEADAHNLHRFMSGAPVLDNFIEEVRFSPDGSLIAASIGSTIRIIDLHTDQPVATLITERADTASICFSPDGKSLAIANTAGLIAIWNFAADSAPHLTTHVNHPAARIDWSSDARSIVVAAGTEAILFDADTLTPRHTFKGHAFPCMSARFSPDASRIVTASPDRTVRVWGTESGLELLVLRAHELFVHDARFSHDGNWIMSVAADNSIRLWDGRPVTPTPGRSAP